MDVAVPVDFAAEKRYTLATQLVKETPAKYLPVNKKELSQILTNPSRWLQRNRKVLKKNPFAF